MLTKIIEVTNGRLNWGKFLVGRLDSAEWSRPVKVPGGESSSPLLRAIGMDPRQILVLDLQTGEGALFLPGGLASADLAKHSVGYVPCSSRSWNGSMARIFPTSTISPTRSICRTRLSQCTATGAPGPDARGDATRASRRGRWEMTAGRRSVRGPRTRLEPCTKGTG